MANKTSVVKLVIAGENKGAIAAVGGVEKSVGGLQGKLGGLGSAVGGAFSVGAITAFGKKSLDAYSTAAGGVAKLSRITGESAQNASLLSFITQQSGVDAEKASAGWVILAKNISKGVVAAQGIKTVGASGELLPFDQILGNIANKFQELPPGIERTALAVKLFGRGGADMVKILAGGSEAIEAQRQKMQDLGLEFDADGLAKYQDYIQVQRDVQAAIVGTEISIANKLIPTLTKAEELFLHIPKPIRDGAVELGAVAVVAGGLTLAVGALTPALARGAEVLHLKAAAATEATAATSALAAADVVATEATLTEAQAQEALVAAWVAGTPAAAAQATAVEGLAAANAEAASTGTAAAASGGLLAGALPILALGYGVKKAAEYGQSLSDAHASQDQLANASKRDLVKLAALYASTNPKALVAIGKDDVHNLERMKDAVEETGGSIEELDDALDLVQRTSGLVTLGLNFVKDKEKETAAEAIPLAESLRKVGDAAASQAQQTFDAQQALADSTDTVTSSQADLAKAKAAAAGDSDAYRSAVKQESDDLQELAADESAVSVAKQKARDVAGDLHDARAQAIRDLFELNRAVVESGDAELQAADKSLRANEEKRRKNADPRASTLDRKEAADNALIAEHEATSAAQDHAKAIGDAAKASADGIEGDKNVVDAKKKVADANADIVTAEQKVKDQRATVTADGVAKSKVIEQAVLDVKSAQDKVNSALYDQAQRYRDVATATLGPVAGLQAYNTELKNLYDTLDPNSDLAQRVAALLAGVKAAISLDLGIIPDSTARGGAAAPGTPGSAIPPTRNPDQGVRSSRIVVNQNLVVNGEPSTKQKRQAKALAREGLGEVVRAAG